MDSILVIAWKHGLIRTPSCMERTYYGCWIHYDREGSKGVFRERVIEALQAEGAKVGDAVQPAAPTAHLS